MLPSISFDQVNLNTIVDVTRIPAYVNLACFALGAQVPDVGRMPAIEERVLMGCPTMF